MKILIFLAIAFWPVTTVLAIRAWQFTGVKLQQMRDKRQRELAADTERYFK